MPDPLTEGPVTNPQAGAVLAQTEPLPGGLYDVGGLVWGAVPFEAELQLRRGGLTTWGQLLSVTPSWFVFRLPMRLYCSAGDHVRIVARNAVVGEVQASLMVWP